MDANGTRFHLVLTKEEWGGDRRPPGLDWSDQSRTLSLAPRSFVFPVQGATQPPSADDRRGGGRDRYGNWYWIGADRNEIRFRGARAEASEHFWSSADETRSMEVDAAGGFSKYQTPNPTADAPRTLVMAGLAVTSDHYLVVGLRSPAGLLVFDLHAAGGPFELTWPADVPFTPFDIAPGARGGAWVLDRANRMLWHLDRHFRVCAERWTSPPQTVVLDFGAAFGSPPCEPRRLAPGQSFSPDRALPLPFAHAIAVEALPDDSVLILESNPSVPYSVVHRYRAGRLAGSVSLERALAGRIAVNPDRPPLAADYGIAGHDLAFVPDADRPPDAVRGTVFIVARSGNQAFAFRIDDQMYASLPGTGAGMASTPDPQYFPLRLFGGNAIVAAGGGAYYDIEDVASERSETSHARGGGAPRAVNGRWVRLARQPRPRFALEATCTLPPPGQADDAFDGKTPGCVWHRVFLDACIPPDCEVTIESRAADRPDLLPLASWRQEPGPYRRHAGAEIPYFRPALPGYGDQTGTWETLLQAAVGRYLQLRLTLRGSGRSTPRLAALRLYYPRFSYLREYLPAIYREDAGSASFLDRYLANVEGLFTGIEDRIEHSAALFDNRLVPAEYLDWLAGWVSATLDPAWTEDRRRFFLAHAWRMFRERGTAHGIARAIRLTLDDCVDDTLFDSEARPPSFAVRIVERFLARRAPGRAPADAAEIHQRYREVLRARYESLDALNAAWATQHGAFDDIRFTVAPEGDRRRAADWHRFVTEALGFTYVAPLASDEPWFRDFLSTRYRHVADLRRAYNLETATGPASFADIALPSELPAAGPAFRDWVDFVSIVLPARRSAHRFTVLVPVRPSDPHDVRLRKMEMARRIAGQEKPAHTDFDVSPYWALFRVGEGRLGADSELGDGSRVTAIELGATALGDGFIPPAHPWDVHDRLIAGRERFGGDRTGGTPAVLEH